MRNVTPSAPRCGPYLLDNPEVLMEAIGVLEQRQAAADAERDEMGIAANDDALFNSAFDWVGGNPEGDVVLVEFMDYRCGYCRRAHPRGGRPGRTRTATSATSSRNSRSSANSRFLASQFAIATRIVNGDDAYAQMNDALMTMRGDVTEGLACRHRGRPGPRLGADPRRHGRSAGGADDLLQPRPRPAAADFRHAHLRLRGINWCGATSRSMRCSRSWTRCART